MVVWPVPARPVIPFGWVSSPSAVSYTHLGDCLMNLSGLFFLNKLALSWFNLSPEAYGMALELMVRRSRRE